MLVTYVVTTVRCVFQGRIIAAIPLPKPVIATSDQYCTFLMFIAWFHNNVLTLVLVLPSETQ